MNNNPQHASAKNTGITTLHIDGMTCAHCVEAVTKALSAVPGIKVRSVEIGLAEVESGVDVAPKAIVAIEEAGYTAQLAEDVESTEPKPIKGGANEPRVSPGAHRQDDEPISGSGS